MTLNLILPLDQSITDWQGDQVGANTKSAHRWDTDATWQSCSCIFVEENQTELEHAHAHIQKDLNDVRWRRLLRTNWNEHQLGGLSACRQLSEKKGIQEEAEGEGEGEEMGGHSSRVYIA